MDLAWSAIRAWRRRREVDPTTRREWVRLYVGVIRRARRGGALKGSPLNCELPSNSLDPDQSVPSVPRTVADRLAATAAMHRSAGSRPRAGGRVHGVRRCCRGRSWGEVRRRQARAVSRGIAGTNIGHWCDAANQRHLSGCWLAFAGLNTRAFFVLHRVLHAACARRIWSAKTITRMLRKSSELGAERSRG
jgi:hypothetical protein